MNMISTGAFLPETDASTKQNELVKKLTAAWEKKNSKTARAGGASLMALSLAACGGEDNTPFSAADVSAAEAAATTAALTGADGTVYASVDAAVTSNDTAIADAARAEGVASVDITTDNQAAIDAAVAAVDLTTDNAAAIDAAVAADTAFADLASLVAAYDALVAPASSALASTAAETLAGTAGNDTFTGSASMYDAADNVVDGSTTDSDTYTLTVTASQADASGTYTGGTGGVEVAPNVTNVENVNVIAQSVAALEVGAENMTGVTNLTVTREDLTVGGSTISGNKAVVVFGVDAADVATVTIGSATTTATVVQATRAGITVNADNASGDVSVTGASTVSATGQGTGDTLTMTVLGDAAQDALAVDVTTGAEDVVIGAFTGSINVNAATAKSVDLASAAGGATIVAAGETGTPGAGTTGIDVTGVDSSGVTITTSYAGTSTAQGAIEITGTTASNDVATISAVGFTALDNDTTAVDTLNLSGNGAEVTYTLTGVVATTITGSGDHAVNLAGNEALMAGSTISGINTIDLTAGTAGTIDAADWSSTKVDLGFDNQGNAITVGSGVTYEVTADQTTGLDFNFSAAGDGNVTVIAGDDNGTSTAVGTVTVAALDANKSATATSTLTIDASIANISGTTITVGAAQNIVVTGDEDATFTGVITGASFDASASSGIMTLSGLTSGVSSVTTGGGADQITVNHATTDHVVVTNAGNDVVTITATQNGSFVTGAGNDTINIDDVSGSYVVSSGAGNDIHVVSGDADAILVAGEGTDILRVDGAAAVNNNTNFSIAGFETLDLDAALTLSAAQWANNSTVNISSDSSSGVLNLQSAGTETSGITIDASGLTADSTASTTVTIAGTAYADVLTGSALAETFTQTAGNDAIEGGSTGTDTITLLASGSDVDGTASGDAMNGNVINMGTTAIDEATVTSTLGNHLGEGVTSVAGGTATFTFASGSAATSGAVNIAAVQTIGGIENVTGGTGEDYIVGSANDNTLTGAAGDDVIIGGDGDDTINGSADADTLTGGLGGDTFVLSDGVAGGDTSGSDTITDFVTTTDTIQLDISDFALNSGAAGALGAAQYYEGAAGSMTAGTAYDVVVLTGASYATVGAAEDAVAAQSTSATDGFVIFHDSATSTVRMFFDADLDADNNLANTATVEFSSLDDATNAGAIGDMFAVGDFSLIA